MYNKKWVTKMLGYDIEIIYKTGKQNMVLDALLRKYEDVETLLFSLSIIQPDYIVEVREQWKNNPLAWTLIQKIEKDPNVSYTFVWKNDSLWYKDHLYICKESQLKQKFLLELHTSLVGGKLGFLETYHRVKNKFLWEGLKYYVQRFMEECLVCKQNKVEIVKILGLLQPPNIPCQC